RRRRAAALHLGAEPAVQAARLRQRRVLRGRRGGEAEGSGHRVSGVSFTPVRQARASGEIVSQIERAIFDGDLKTGDRLESERAPHTEASMDFHVAVADAAKNELLSATVAAYRDLLVQTLHDMRDVRSAKATQKAHEEILDAIRSHDPEAARALMLEHLQDFEKRLRRWLATQEQTEIVTRARLRPARTG